MELSVEACQQNLSFNSTLNWAKLTWLSLKLAAFTCGIVIGFVFCEKF